MPELLTGGTTLTLRGWSSDGLVLDGEHVGSAAAGSSMSRPMRKRDVTGLSLIPGYVELQVNGGWGIDLQRDPHLLWSLAARLPEVGVTTFLPTLTTNGFRNLDVALDALADGPPSGWTGADPLGWHLEGPWLAEGKAGAHDVEAMQSPSTAPPLAAANGVRLVTLAPELAGAAQLIEKLIDNGIVVSMGHSAATLSQARVGALAGATMGTHVFNAMDGLHHRNPGLAAALLLDDLAVGLIADGHHVAPDLVDLAWRLAGKRIVLVSDAVAAMGTSDDSVARLDDGTMAGSLVGLDQCVRNLMAFADVDLADAVSAASAVPAGVLSLEDRGVLQPGARADIVGLDAEGYVALTIIGGQVVFER